MTDPTACDEYAEQVVLGACMLAPDAIVTAAEILRPEDFWKPAHGIVFEAMLDLYERGEPIQAGPVMTALTRSGQLSRVGGGEYLHTLISLVPTVANASWYAGQVAEKAELRFLHSIGVGITQRAEHKAAAEVVDYAERELAKVTTRSDRIATRTMGDLVAGGIAAIEKAAETKGKLRGLSTRILDLDAMLNGLQPGQFVVVAGRPGAGKSVLATDIARAVALHQRETALFASLEMSWEEVFSRVAAAEARLNLTKVISGDLTDEEWVTLARRGGEISDAPLHVTDAPGLSLADIRSLARRLKRQIGLSLLIVDYLQLVSTPRTENRQVAVAELSRGLKLLAKELEIPVIAVAQLNRGPAQRMDKKPQLSDLRESGALEQDADVVIFVHRDEYYDPTVRPGEADLIVAKNRNGKTGIVPVAAQLHHARFVDMAIT